jgi:hypothetical protein
MATYAPISQFGGSQTWVVWDNGITNHEVWTFTLQDADFGVGAVLSEVAVFDRTDFVPDQTSYEITLTVVDEFLNPLPQGTGFILGNFESTGI